MTYERQQIPNEMADRRPDPAMEEMVAYLGFVWHEGRRFIRVLPALAAGSGDPRWRRWAGGDGRGGRR